MKEPAANWDWYAFGIPVANHAKPLSPPVFNAAQTPTRVKRDLSQRPAVAGGESDGADCGGNPLPASREPLSFPKIISGHNGGAARTRLG